MSHVLASFFDIGDNGFDASDAGIITVLLGALTAGLRWTWRRWRQGKSWSEAKLKEALRPVIHEVVTEVMADALKHVDKRTEPIQKNANGGRSLGDLADRVGKVESTITEVRGTVTGLDSRLDVIEGLLRAIVGGHPRTDP